MKLSNILTTLILALFISLALNGQKSSTHVISIHDEDESLHIEFKDGDISLFKIDGVTINKKDYPTYQHIFDRYKDRQNSSHSKTKYAPRKSDMQDLLIEKLVDYLVENKGMDDTDFEFKMTEKKMVVNSTRLSRSRLKDCLEIFEETAGYSLGRGSYFHVDISPGSRSVSLSINE